MTLALRWIVGLLALCAALLLVAVALLLVQGERLRDFEDARAGTERLLRLQLEEAREKLGEARQERHAAVLAETQALIGVVTREEFDTLEESQVRIREKLGNQLASVQGAKNEAYRAQSRADEAMRDVGVLTQRMEDHHGRPTPAP